MATNQANFQVGLQFTADTVQAKKQIQDLQKSLSKLSQDTLKNSTKGGISQEIQQAGVHADYLRQALLNATNINTGRLNLTKFNTSLKNAGLDIYKIQASLAKLGPDGNKAFEQIATSIVNAEKPAIRLGNLANNLLHSFAQTAKYQFTASIYRGLIGGLRSAFDYAKDLNESLNNIRIVTGQSTDQMAKFAEQANKAARALSVTTTQYTNGALIYYQQGLNDEEVKARTDVTMKLANASGVSAETASQQLTAIWNNFAKGSENLEYFADVMTALGASTASSTSEIAEGLEKFAAIGNTVGLSYEYAASALATVTATTRQSADVVGTAFKTLFARIQDLEVGETLEDGTTLGKYSQALAAVGVNIKDANGELKAMDQILEEIAAAWQTISKDQQVALAQTVAGTRQYTQLVALMENWSFMQKNLQTSYDSTGTLQKQADIYAESWEAARAKVKAAAEDLYSALIDDKFFITILGGAEKLITGIKTLMDHLGGLPGLLSTIGALVTNFGFDTIVNSINRQLENTKTMLGITGRQIDTLKNQTLEALNNSQITQYGKEYAEYYQSSLGLTTKFAQVIKNMTPEMATLYQIQIDRIKSQGEELKNQIEINKKKLEELEIEKQKQAAMQATNLSNTTNKVAKALGSINPNEEVKQFVTHTSYKGEETRDLSFRLRGGMTNDAYYNLLKNTTELEKELTDKQKEALRTLKEQVQNGGKEVAQAASEAAKAFRESVKIQNLNFTNREESFGYAKGLVNQAIDNKNFGGRMNESIIAAYNKEIEAGGVPQSVIDSFNTYKKLVESGVTDSNKLKAALENLQEVSKNIKIEAQPISDKLKEALNYVSNLKSEISSMSSIQSLLGEIDPNNVTQLENYKQNIEKLVEKLSGEGYDTSALSNALKQLNESASGENIVAVQEALRALNAEVGAESLEKIQNYAKTITTTDKDYNNVVNALVSYRDALAKAKAEEEQTGTVSENLQREIERLRQKLEELGAAAQGTGDKLKNFDKGANGFAKNMTTVLRSITTGVSAYNAFKGVTTQAAEGTLKFGDALTSIAGNLMMVIPSVSAFAGMLGGGPIGWIAGIATALIPIIVGIIKGKQEADALGKKFEQLSEAYDEAKESAENFKNTASNYSGAIEELEKLTKGTEEYKEKVEEANKAAQELIDNYGDDLAGKWHFDISTGRIIIDEKALEKLQDTLNGRAVQAGDASLAAKIDLNNSANQTLLKEISGNKETQKALQDLAEIYSHNGQDLEGAFNRLDSTQQALLNETNIDQNKIQEYLKQVNGKQLDNIQYQKKINGNLVKFNEDYLNGANDEVKRDFVYDYTVANGASASERQAAANVDSLSDENGLYFQLRERSNAEDPYWLNKYLQESGRLDVEKFDAIAEDIKKSFELLDLSKLSTVQQNEFQRLYRVLTNNQLSLNDRVNALRGLIDFDKTNNLLTDLKTSVEIIEEDNKNQATAEELFDKTAELFGEDETNALNFLNGIKNGQSGGLSYLRQNMTYSGLNAFSPDDFAKTFGRGLGWITHDEGTEEYEKDLKNFTEKLKKYQEEAFNDLQKTANKSFGEIFNYNDLNSDAFKNISNEQFSKIINSSNNIAKQYGPEVARTIKEAMLNEEDPFGLLMAIDNIDWSDTSLTDAFKKLKEAGYKLSEDTFLNFAKILQDSATNAKYFTSSLKDLLSAFKEVQDIISKVSFGQVISSEDYEKLIKDRKDLEGKFVYTINGWLYIGDTNDLNNSNFNAMEDIDKNFETAQREIETVKSDVNLKNFDNQQIAWNYGGDKFNTLAGARSGVDVKALQEALDTLESETASKDAKDFAQKIVDAYATAIRELPSLEKQFDESNRATTYVQQTVKSLDELEDKWDELSERYKTLDKETATRIVAANELVSRGIDVSEWENYYKTLIKLHPELKNNTELAMRMATANMVASNGLKTLSSNYANWIKTLETAKDTNTLDSADAVEALNGFQSALADIVSLEQEDLNQISADFLIKHAELIKEAMNGEETAMYQLIAYAMETQGVIQENQVQDYIKLQEWIAEHPLATALEINAYLKSTDSSLASLIGTKDLNTLLEAGGAEIYGGKWYARDLNVKSLTPDDKGKSSSKKNLKSLDDEIDRYHYIRKLLADIERELERVDKAKERAYGSQHLKYIEQETDYLREQVGLQDRYINEIEGYLAKDRGLIAAYGAQFDAAGNISNYNELFASNFNKYANADDSTNWENFKKALSTYEETLDLWFEQTEEKAELLRQILDKQLEGISYKVEVEVALDDREIALLEHQLNRLDDAAYDTAAALANIGEQFKNTEDSIKSTTNGIVDVLKTIPGITQDQINRYLAGDGDALAGLHIEQGQIELLEQYSDQLLELSDRLKELHDSALQKVTEAFDAWGEKIEDHVAKFEHLNNVLNNYEEIIGILGRNNLGISNEFMRAMRNQEITNLQSILNTRTQTKDVLTAQLADARQKASEAATEAEREDWEQIVTDLEGRLREATESWQQAWIDALQANKEAFEQTMQELVDSFDDYADELKRYDTAEDRYLETYRQAYELSKLGRDIQNSINDQDSIRAKKELQKLEDKINALKESGRAISENELGLLQKEYELRLAEIALEDAQNAKSLVRLERDNEGNWGYVYTADQENIEKARQDYEDKLYEYMRLADTMAEESSRAILTLNKEMAEALAALDTDAEDYEAKVAEITQFYTDQINYFAEQYGISVDAINNVARESAAKYKPEVVDIIDSDNSGLQTNFAETVLAIIGDFEDLEDAVAGPDGALPNIQRAYTETLAAFEDYRVQNARTCELAGADIKTLSGLMQDEFDSIKEKADSIDASTKTMTDTMSSYLSGVLNSFNEFATNYSAKAKVINTANEALASSIIQLETVLQNLDAGSLASLKKAADQVGMIAQKVKEISNSAGDGGSGSGGDKDAGFLAGYNYVGATADGTTLWAKYVGNGKNDIYALKNNKLTYSWSTYGRTSSFDTGGYTGEWGQSGRLALLHEKELVLNKQDTANILDAVSLIRQMTLGTAQLSHGLGNIGAGLANFNVSPGTMDQNVSISASFPNVVDHNEIEEALTNLVNKASQYAFRPNLT